MKLSSKDKRFVACVMNIEALSEIALEDVATALPYKKQSTSIHEWNMIQQTLEEIKTKVEWITDKITEETKPEYIESAIGMSYTILREAELIQEERDGN